MSDDTKSQTSRWLSSLSIYCRAWLYTSVLLGVVNGILIIAQAFLLASILYRVVISEATRSTVMYSMLVFLLLVILRAFISYLREIVNLKTAVFVKTALRERLIHHIVQLGPIRLSTYQTGAISNALIEQVEAVHDFFAHYLPQMLLVGILPILILIVVFPKSSLAGFLLLVTAPLIPLFMIFIGRGAESEAQKQFEQVNRMSGHFLDVLRGLMTLKLFKSSVKAIRDIAKVSDEYRKRTMKVLRIAFLSSAVLELFSSIAIALLAVYLGLSLLGLIHISFGFLTTKITLQSALFILILAPEFFLPLRQLGVHYHARAQAIGAAKELQKILNLKLSEHTERKLCSSHKDIAIVFDKVNFSYHETPILLDFDLNFSANQHTAIVGESGVGKTTILNLIAGFIEPNSGGIRINGQYLKQLDLDSWRQRIAWVGQNTRLLYGSIRENLLIAKPDASKEALFFAIQVAYLDKWIQQLPNGLDTIIGGQNFGLSYGQIQRIALCRAYLKNTPVLLLDEATAHLDAYSENIILDSIKAMSREKTIISATHRKSMMLKADTLIELKGFQSVDRVETTVKV